MSLSDFFQTIKNIKEAVESMPQAIKQAREKFNSMTIEDESQNFSMEQLKKLLNRGNDDTVIFITKDQDNQPAAKTAFDKTAAKKTTETTQAAPKKTVKKQTTPKNKK